MARTPEQAALAKTLRQEDHSRKVNMVKYDRLPKSMRDAYKYSTPNLSVMNCKTMKAFRAYETTAKIYRTGTGN